MHLLFNEEYCEFSHKLDICIVAGIPGHWYVLISNKAVILRILALRAFLAKISKIQNSWHFNHSKIILTICQIINCLDTLHIKNLDKIVLQFHFCKNFKIQNGLHFWSFFFENGFSVLLGHTGVQNSDEITVSPTVRGIEAILCFAKILKNGRHIWKKISKVGTTYC